MGPQHRRVRGRRRGAPATSPARAVPPRSDPHRRRRRRARRASPAPRARDARVRAARSSPRPRDSPSRSVPTTVRGAAPDDRDRHRARPRSTELNRTVAHRGCRPRHRARRCSRPRAAEHFEALACRDLADVIDDGARARTSDRRARGRAGSFTRRPRGRRTRGASTSYAGGRDRGLRHHHRPPPATRSVPRSPTGSSGPRRSRTSAPSCGPGSCAAPAAGRPPRSRRTSPSGWRRSGTLGILDTEPEARFDRYTEVACSTFDVPMALVTLDRRRAAVVQVARTALDVAETHRDDVDVRARDPRATTCSWSPTRSATTASPTTRTWRAGRGCASTRACRCRSPTASASAPSASWTTVPRLLNEPQFERLRELGRMVEAELDATGGVPRGDQ